MFNNFLSSNPFHFPPLQFFPTTGRDEIFEDKDQLYHDGIELDRAGDIYKSQDIAMAHKTFFAPTYEETEIAYSPLTGSISFG